jgi:hypothetical protein
MSGDKNPVDPRPFAGAQNRAKIVWIFDVVEQDNQREGAERGEDLVGRHLLTRSPDDGHNPLMVSPFCEHI